VQINLTVRGNTYSLLQRLAVTKRGFGRLVDDAISVYANQHESDEIRHRLEQLENQVEALTR
jgi:hypothetical protein